MTQEIQNKPSLQRYLFATILPIILLSITLSISILDQKKQYQFTKNELVGIQTMEFLYSRLTELQKIRGYTQIVLGGHNDVQKNLGQQKNNFLNGFQQQFWIQQVDNFNLQNESDLLFKQAQQLFQVHLPNAKSQELFAKHSNLITSILQLMQLTADRSNLILDPELDTYYLIDVLNKQIPYLVESIGRVRGTASGLISKGFANKDDLENLQNYLSAIETRIENIDNAQAIIAKVSSKMTEELHLIPDELDQFISKLNLQCDLIKEQHSCQKMHPKEFFQQATQAIDLLTTPYHAGIAILTSKIQKRQDKHIIQGVIVLCGTTITILLMLYFNRAFYLYDKKHFETLAKLSVTDQLTGLYNRRHLYTVFPRQLRATIRYEENMYLGILDVDNFKRFNDTYGHPKGDLALQQISMAMNEVLQRANDYSFRIGGEEFCFFFNESNLKKAEQLTNKICSTIEDLAIPHEKNKPHGKVTVSIGLIAVPAASDTALEKLISGADKALYKAKESGRNRYIVG